MPTFTVTFLSRDAQERYERKHKRLSATDHEEALAYINHGYVHGKWALEGDITVHGPIGRSTCDTKTFEC